MAAMEQSLDRRRWMGFSSLWTSKTNAIYRAVEVSLVVEAVVALND